MWSELSWKDLDHWYMKNVMLCCSLMHVNTAHLQKAESGYIEIYSWKVVVASIRLWWAFSVNEYAIRILILYIPMSGCTIQGTWAMPTVSWARSWSQVGRESTYEKLTRSEQRIKLLEMLVVSFNCSMSPALKSRSFTAKPRAALRLYYGAQRQRYNTYSLWDGDSLQWE